MNVFEAAQQRIAYIFDEFEHIMVSFSGGKDSGVVLNMTIDESKMEAVAGLLQTLPQDQTIIFCRFIKAQDECRKRWPKVTVLSMQKESLGLNLQRYRHTIFFDRVWDYALLLQASRRTYRTGQEQDCHYYELTGNVGLEHMMAENIKKKVSMSEYLKKITKEELYECL